MNTFLIASQSLDGYIAPTATERSTNWTSSEDLRFFIDRTKQAEVILVGSTTFSTFRMMPQPKKVNLVYTHKSVAEFEKLREKWGKSFSVVNLDDAYDQWRTKNHKVDGEMQPLDLKKVYLTAHEPRELIDILDEMGYPELAVCGGATIYDLFLRSGVINKVYLTIEPIFFGQGVKLLQSGALLRLRLKTQINLSADTLLLEYDFS